MLAPREVGRRAGAPRVPRPLPAPRSGSGRPVGGVRSPGRTGPHATPAAHCPQRQDPQRRAVRGTSAVRSTSAAHRVRGRHPGGQGRGAASGSSTQLPAGEAQIQGSRATGRFFAPEIPARSSLLPPIRKQVTSRKQLASPEANQRHQRPANPPFSSPQAFRRSGPSPGPQRWRLRRSCGSGVGRGRPLRS